MNSAPNSGPRRTTYITLICILLWTGAAAFIGLGVWIAIQGVAVTAAASFLAAALMVAAGLGLYRMRRWGVIAFGLLMLIQAANLFADAIRSLMQSSTGDLLPGLFSLALAVVVAGFMSYWVVLLWRLTK